MAKLRIFRAAFLFTLAGCQLSVESVDEGDTLADTQGQICPFGTVPGSPPSDLTYHGSGRGKIKVACWATESGGRLLHDEEGRCFTQCYDEGLLLKIVDASGNRRTQLDLRYWNSEGDPSALMGCDAVYEEERITGGSFEIDSEPSPFAIAECEEIALADSPISEAH